MHLRFSPHGELEVIHLPVFEQESGRTCILIMASPTQWDLPQVQAWLTESGFENLCSVFAEHEVTGNVLLRLKDYELEHDLGLRSVIKRAKLLKAIQALAQQCPPDSASACSFSLKSQPHQKPVYFKMLNDSWHKRGERVKDVVSVFEIQNPALTRAYKDYCAEDLGGKANEMVLFHGVQDSCGGRGCSEGMPRCGACGIPSEGFRLSAREADVESDRFQRFGSGIYFARDSSKSHGTYLLHSLPAVL